MISIDDKQNLDLDFKIDEKKKFSLVSSGLFQSDKKDYKEVDAEAEVDVEENDESEIKLNDELNLKKETTDVLNWSQVKKLNELLTRTIQIHGRNSMPTLDVTLKDFIRFIYKRLIDQRVRVRDIRINGGVASYILANQYDYQYSDIDIIFSCDLLKLESKNLTDSNKNNYTNNYNENEDPSPNSSLQKSSFNIESSFTNCCDTIKQTVLDCLLEYFPSQYNKENLTMQYLKESYVKKMAKIYTQCNSNAPTPTTSSSSSNLLSCSPASSLFTNIESNDSLRSSSRWSLISLYNDQGQNIELKFVDKMKRQFQFSVDSFQIHLDSILSYYDCMESDDNEMTENFYPSVVAESMYGNFKEALQHLNSKLIATISPEEIRGGGLLKYCNLLIRDYKSLYDSSKMHTLEKYMCSRFFIDFSDIKDQEHKLRSYLDSHFYNDPKMCVKYLNKLYQVVNSSTVCLMGHERKQTLGLIESLAMSITNNAASDLNFRKESFNDIIKLNNNDNDSFSQQANCSSCNNSAHSSHSSINNYQTSKHFNSSNDFNSTKKLLKLTQQQQQNNKKLNQINQQTAKKNMNTNNNNNNNNTANNTNANKTNNYKKQDGSNNFYNNSKASKSKANINNNCNYYFKKESPNENRNLFNDNLNIPFYTNNNNSRYSASRQTISNMTPSPSLSPSPSPSHSSICSISSLYNEELVSLKASKMHQNFNNNNNMLPSHTNSTSIPSPMSLSNTLLEVRSPMNSQSSSPSPSPTIFHHQYNSQALRQPQQTYLIKYLDLSSQETQENETKSNKNNVNKNGILFVVGGGEEDDEERESVNYDHNGNLNEIENHEQDEKENKSLDDNKNKSSINQSAVIYPYIEIFDNCFCPPTIIPIYHHHHHHHHHNEHFGNQLIQNENVYTDGLFTNAAHIYMNPLNNNFKMFNQCQKLGNEETLRKTGQETS